MSLTSQANTTQRLLVELTDKHRAIMSAMVWGLTGKMAEKHRKTPGKALSQYDVAEVFHVRRAYVRDLLGDPLFKGEFVLQLMAKRAGYMPEALERVADIMRSDNEPVALRASETILGERGSNAGVSVTVNNQVNNATAIRPGYVIRLPAELSRDAPADQD